MEVLFPFWTFILLGSLKTIIFKLNGNKYNSFALLTGWYFQLSGKIINNLFFLVTSPKKKSSWFSSLFHPLKCCALILNNSYLNKFINQYICSTRFWVFHHDWTPITWIISSLLFSQNVVGDSLTVNCVIVVYSTQLFSQGCRLETLQEAYHQEKRDM